MKGSKYYILEHIRSLSRYARISEPDILIELILLSLGVSNKGKGIRYLKTAIHLYYNNPAQHFVDGVYRLTALAEGENCTAAQIEIGMRRAIRDAWEHSTSECWKFYFPDSTADGKKAPTNKQFISCVCNAMKLWEESLQLNEV